MRSTARRERLGLVALVAVAVVMQHFELFRVAGFSVTVGFLLGVPLIVYLSGTRRVSLAVVAGIAVSGYSALVAMCAPGEADGWDFFTTLALLVVATATVTIASAGLRPEFLRQARHGLFLALVVIVAFSVAQVLAGAAGSASLFNPWGDHQYQYQYQPRLELTPIPRAQGFFLEPSYDAFVIGSVAITLLLLRARAALVLPLAVVGMMAAQSATGMVLLSVMLVLFALKSRPAVGVAVLVLAAVFFIAVQGYLSTRLGSIGDVGTSGNYRLLAPLAVLSDVLTTHPLGLPLGSIYDVVPRYDLVMAGVAQTISIDNGFYVIVYYFGWVGLLILAFALVATARLVARRGSLLTGGGLAAAWVLGSLFFSGGIVAPEYGVMVSLVVGAGVVAFKGGERDGQFTAAAAQRDISHV